MIWGVVGAVVAALVGGSLVWRARKKKRSQLISLVALLRDPAEFDSAVLANLAGKAWDADLGDGSSEGADGFVVGVGVMNTVVHDGRMYLVNSFPRPYTDDVEKVAEGIGDPRLRSLFLEHRAWFSCDAMGIDGTTPPEEVLDRYRRLGRLFAELLDENCLLIFLPDTGRAYPVNEETEAALRSPDPVAALQATRTAPMVEVSDDDPAMVKAVQRARAEWPRFVAAYEAGLGENFAAKAPVSRGGRTEFIWLTVTAIEGERIYGELANDPADLGSLKLGSKVAVSAADLNDWCYADPQGNLVGGFTIAALQKAASRKKRG